MAAGPQDDEKETTAKTPAQGISRGKSPVMTSFVESCVETAAGSAAAAERAARHRPRARRLIKLLAGKKNVLVTTHVHPDPDALASSFALCYLLQMMLPEASVAISVKGNIGGGYNRAFLQQTAIRLTPWSDEDLGRYDAIVLLDVQPNVRFSPLPANVTPTAVVDHHRSRGRRPHCPFCDIRTDVGATSSIIFSYFMELDVEIPADMAATLLFAIETDLAGAAGQPGDMDNLALSSLTLVADTQRLYKMRYADLPLSIYTACYSGLGNAFCYANAMISHLDTIESPEAPAVIADFLLRYEEVQWSLVSAVNGSNLALSLRTSAPKLSAADVMRRLLRNLGEGGGHRTKAGGAIPLTSGSEAEIDRLRTTLKRRFLRILHIPMTRGTRLVPRAEK